MKMKFYYVVLTINFLVAPITVNANEKKEADLATTKEQLKKEMEKMSPDQQAQFRNFMTAFGGASLIDEFKSLSEEEINVILRSPNSDANSLRKVAKTIEYSRKPIPNSSKILQQILNNPNSDGYTYAAVADAIVNVRINSQSNIEGSEKMLQQIIDSSKSNKETLRSAASAISASRPDSQMQLAQKILNSTNVSGMALQNLLMNMGALDEADKDLLIIQIANSPALDSNTLSQLMYHIESSPVAVNGLDKIIHTMLNSTKMDVTLLNRLVYSLKKAQTPIPDIMKYLQLIIDSPISDGSTLAAIVYSQTYSEQPVWTEQILQQALNAKKATSETFLEIVRSIGHSKRPLSGSDKMIIQIINSPLTDKSTLETVERVVQTSKEKFQDAGLILRKVKELKRLR